MNSEASADLVELLVMELVHQLDLLNQVSTSLSYHGMQLVLLERNGLVKLGLSLFCYVKGDVLEAGWIFAKGFEL
jgi:hypothetical protein